ncbi:O-methyltransferase-domain-containing protein [Whalleya microplaca]|nr:O-methyltransferase-domain-containing protein [Whalleya microplaca]
MATADQLLASLDGVSSSSFVNETERTRARDALFEALRRVHHITWDQNWVNLATSAVIRTLIDAGVFGKWAENGGGPMTSPQLAELTGVDTLLLRRLLRHVAGQNLITEMAEDTYAPTPWAKAIASDPALASVYQGFYHKMNTPLFRTLPYFLKETGYKNPSDVNKSNFQFCHGPDSSFFQFAASDPEVTVSFNNAMECHSRYNLSPWPDVYPTDSIIDASKSKPDRPLFRQRHPDILPGSLILQDLADILKGVEIGKGIIVQPHDFFTPQPVQGARAYFLHNVLHDWPDDVVKNILTNITCSMEKGYSRLLVHESLVSSLKPSPRVTTSDITIMTKLAAKERSESEWKELLTGACLRIINIWRPPQSVESVIETELA